MKKEYYIKLSDGQVVPVTEDVYREYKRPQWREAKQKKVRQMREFSLEYMTENGMEHIYSDKQKLVEEIAEDNLMLETLMKALERLTDDEHFLIKDKMLETYRNDGDIHAQTTSVIYNIPFDEAINKNAPHYKERRSVAKNCNFGVFYGLFPNGLMRNLKKAGIEKTKQECTDIIESLMLIRLYLKQRKEF